jgi:hypothetical protein
MPQNAAAPYLLPSVPEMCYIGTPLGGFPPRIAMNENQEQLAFNHQTGLALTQWQHNVEFGLYVVAAACSGQAPPADTYTTFFNHKSFRQKLKQVDDLVSQKVRGTPLLADWRKLHSRIETAEKGRNALAHRWVLIYPNGKPGRRWCLLPRIGARQQHAPDRPPNGALCVRDISNSFSDFPRWAGHYGILQIESVESQSDSPSN